MSAPGVHVGAVAYETPAIDCDVYELEARGLLQTPARTLHESGFERCRIAQDPPCTMARRAVQKLLEETGTRPEAVQLLVTASAMPTSTMVPPGDARTLFERTAQGLDITRYTGTRVQHELKLVNARTLGVTELGCVALLEAVWLAHRLMDEEGWDTAVCVNADLMPEGFPREILHSVISDSACAVLLTRDPAGHRIVAHGQMTRGFYWDAQATPGELLAAYYPTGKRLIANTLAKCGLGWDDIACVIPNNVSRRSWEAMCDVLRLPMDRVYTDNIARCGHAMAADQFINLHDALQAGRIKRGDRVLLYGFGLGAHWACSVVEI